MFDWFFSISSSFLLWKAFRSRAQSKSFEKKTDGFEWSWWVGGGNSEYYTTTMISNNNNSIIIFCPPPPASSSFVDENKKKNKLEYYSISIENKLEQRRIRKRGGIPMWIVRRAFLTLYMRYFFLALSSLSAKQRHQLRQAFFTWSVELLKQVRRTAEDARQKIN